MSQSSSNDGRPSGGGGTPSRLGEWNRRALMRELRLGAPISRVALAGRTGISKPAVTRGISDLMKEGWVIETGRGESTSAGGKRPTLLELNPVAAAGIGCMIEVGRVSAALVGFNAEFETRRQATFDVSQGPEAAIQVLTRILRDVADANPNDRPLLGIGVGVPGLVDESGRLIVMPHLPGWKGISLAELLEREFGIPAYVDNESRVQALAEGWYGLGRGVDTFVCLETGIGVSAGIVMNGRLWRGVHSLAGEVGHSSIYTDGDRCYCDSRSCWEVYASTSQFLDDVHTSSIAHNDARLRDEKLTIDAVVKAVELGDATALRELEIHVDALARGLCNLVLAYDPQRIILHGESTLFGDRLVRMLKRRIRDRFSLWLEYDAPIIISELGENAGIAGAVSLALRGAWGLPEDRMARG